MDGGGKGEGSSLNFRLVGRQSGSSLLLESNPELTLNSPLHFYIPIPLYPYVSMYNYTNDNNEDNGDDMMIAVVMTSSSSL